MRARRTTLPYSDSGMKVLSSAVKPAGAMQQQIAEEVRAPS